MLNSGIGQVEAFRGALAALQLTSEQDSGLVEVYRHAIAERDSAIAERDSAIAERDSAIVRSHS